MSGGAKLIVWLRMGMRAVKCDAMSRKRMEADDVNVILWLGRILREEGM